MDGMNLPSGFIESLAPVLNGELQDFLRTYLEPYHRALRLNPKRETVLVEGLGDKVAWEPNGFYIANNSMLGASILHEAGCYYIQEPSAMAPVAVLDPKKGECILDLCAAPGGKSTQIAARMQGEGLLVANEPVYKRAQILAQNVERMGIENALVVSAMPQTLSAKWPHVFDTILVDAPCSGEGMFRRHPETRAQWTAEAPEGCAKRQKEILAEAFKMLKSGGRLVYSTCTLNMTENEEVCKWFVSTYPQMRLKPFTLEGAGHAADGMLHLWPHKLRGEGHFVALFEKEQADGTGTAAWNVGLLKAPAKTDAGDFPLDITPDFMLGETLLKLKAYPDLRGVKVLRAGLHLGQLRGKHFVPDHALAMAQRIDTPMPIAAFNEAQAVQFLRGEAVAGEGKGYMLVMYAGAPLGFVKASDGWYKNHYPKGLRR